MAQKTLFMETTSIAPEQTAGEIVSTLVKAGASSVNMTYQDGQIIGLQWLMMVNGENVLFAMPARVEPVYKILRKRRVNTVTRNIDEQLRAQARRVAWRQLLRWVQAQMAMVDTGMVKVQEVFLAYVQVPWAGQSVYELFESKGMKMLPPPERPQ